MLQLQDISDEEGLTFFPNRDPAVLYRKILLWKMAVAKSLDTFLLISVPIAVNKPPSLKPVALSIGAPMGTPPATPAPTMSFLTMFFFLIMVILYYLIQLEHRMSYFVLYHMDYYLLFSIVFLMQN